MNLRPISNNNPQIPIPCLGIMLLGILSLLSGCIHQPQPTSVEEINFQSGDFSLTGELRTPAGKAPFPVVLFVHGSGYADRTMFGMYLPIRMMTK